MKYTFGEKIRSVRERKKLTMKEVARRAGVSESLMSQIERNRISPAIDTLLRIAEVVEIDLEYLFSDFKQKRKVNLVKASERDEYKIGDVRYERLSKTPGTGKHEIEAYYMEVAVNGVSKNEEYGHAGKELGLVLEGEGSFTIGSETYQICVGDSISFDSDVPHRVINTGEIPLRMFWVTTPPKLFNT